MGVERGCLFQGRSRARGKGHCLLERGTSPAQEASLTGGVKGRMRDPNLFAVWFYPLCPFWKDDEYPKGAGGVLGLGREFYKEHSRRPVDLGRLLPPLPFGSVGRLRTARGDPKRGSHNS